MKGRFPAAGDAGDRGGSGGLVSTALAVPRPSRPVIPRPSLSARLDDGDWRLAVVAAPAGFGKTTLLADWASARPDPPAWLSCDVGDAEPVRFWSRLVAAAAVRWPGVGDDATVLLERTGVENHDVAVALANDLADVPDPVLVVDDIHLAKPSPSLFAAFVEAIAPTTRTVLGGRTPPPIALARRRVSGHLLEIHGEDLRFSEVESAGLLALHGVAAKPAEMARLQAITEGWPAAVQLAALALRRDADRAGFLDALASTERAMADFLVDEVLTDLPDDWVEFLSATCVLERFDADLCARMTGRDDAEAVLEGLIDTGMFVVPLDDAGRWYRYHHLFAACLQARVRASSATRFRHLNEQASEALEARGLVTAALRRALAYDDTDRAARIARDAFNRQMHPADAKLSGAAARTWLHERGEGAIPTDPVLVLELVATLIATSAPDDAARWIEKVAAAHPAPSPVLSGYLHGVWCEHHLARGQVDQALHHIGIAMASFDGAPPAEGMLPLLYALQTRAHLAAGEVDEARVTIDAAIERPTGVAALDLVRFPAFRAWIAFRDGELGRADRLARTALDRADEVGLGAHEPGRVYTALTLAGLHAERLELDAAADGLNDARRHADLLSRPSLQCLVALAHAGFAREIGDVDTARAELAAARVLTAHPSASIVSRFDLEAARQAVAFGARSAGSLVDALDRGRRSLLLRVRFALERQNVTAAAEAVALLPTPTTTRECIEDAMAHALVARDVGEAITRLEGALDLAAPEQFVRAVVDAGPGVPRLLAALPTSVHTRYLARLIDAVQTMPSTRCGDRDGLVEPLTPRELEVLRHLSSRLTNQEIASALYVSVNTLKTHVKSVYRKLGVASRTQAVAVGRGIRLI